MHSLQYCCFYDHDGGVDVDNDHFARPVVVNVELCHLVGEVVIHCCDVEHLLKVAEVVAVQQQGYQELSLASSR